MSNSPACVENQGLLDLFCIISFHVDSHAVMHLGVQEILFQNVLDQGAKILIFQAMAPSSLMPTCHCQARADMSSRCYYYVYPSIHRVT